MTILIGWCPKPTQPSWQTTARPGQGKPAPEVISHADTHHLTTHCTQAPTTTASHRSLLSYSIPAYISRCIRRRATPKAGCPHTNTMCTELAPENRQVFKNPLWAVLRADKCTLSHMHPKDCTIIHHNTSRLQAGVAHGCASINIQPMYEHAEACARNTL